MSRYLKVASTAKHYALNNVENDRMSASSNTDDANVRDYRTAQFKSLFENAHVSGFMMSYNAINGTTRLDAAAVWGRPEASAGADRSARPSVGRALAPRRLGA